jgi:hypothetical protein
MLAKDLGYIKEERYLQLREDYSRVGKMLTRQCQALKKGC